jgi:hypothetical protein
MDETNISSWTPIGDAPPLAANGSVTAAEFPFAPQEWQPAGTGLQGYERATDSPRWTPALGAAPTVQQTPTTDIAGTAETSESSSNPGTVGTRGTAGITTGLTGAAESTGTGSAAVLARHEEVRHGGPFSRNAWQWSLAVVAAIIGIIVVIEIGLSKLINHFESGTPQRLAVICASLFSNDVVMLGMLIIAAKALGMSFRSFGVRRPADVKESIVLAFAAWLIFLLLGGVWAMVSQSAAEREANNPFLRDKTVNARDASALGLNDGSDAASSETSSAQDNSTESAASTDGRAGSGETSGEGSGFSNDAGTGKVTEANKRTDQDATSQNKDVADNRHALIKVLNDDPPKALLLSILITGCIGAPLLEELLVRGFMFGAFSQRFGKLAGGAISSLLFGFAHIMAYPLKMIPPLVIMGAALAWLAWQTGSIVPGMFIHAFVNSLGLGIAASLGGHIITLMAGSWLVLGIILLPWIRQKKSPAAPAGT